MKHSELKREDFKSGVDYLVSLINRHKNLCDDYLKLIQENTVFEFCQNCEERIDCRLLKYSFQDRRRICLLLMNVDKKIKSN